LKPNVFFLIIDSFRNDEFQKFCKNFPDSYLNKLVEKGTYFSQTVSSADATLLSLSSMLTGKFSFKTGVKSEKLNKLKPNIKTLFQILKDENYHLYGYNPTVVNLANLLPKFENDDSSEESSPRITDTDNKIIEKLSGLKEPWAMFVHVTDLHEPIIIPKQFNKPEYGSSQYEKQIFAIDHKIGELMDEIDLQKTQLIVTADHGTYLKNIIIDKKNISFEDNIKSEVFKKEIGKKIPKFLKPLKDKVFFSQIEHNRKTKLEKIKKMNLNHYEERNLTSEKFDIKHSLFDELLLVPLLFVGNECKSNRIDQQVRSVDILPTLLEILKIKFNENELDGKSLYGLMTGKKDTEKTAYLESNPLIQLKSDDVIGIRTSKYKYFRDSINSNKRIHLYDLQNDPFENENISNKHTELVTKFEKELQNIINSENSESVNDQDKEIYEELKKMGYA
tara:strand:+ start:327 stop:1670 length:1344 start_codon:yes stop_codon:yes gene_type:complete